MEIKMEQTIVDDIYSRFTDLIEFLEIRNQPSFRISVEENFRKSLLLAAASYFEKALIDRLIEFTKDASNSNNLIVEFMKNKSLRRQFHTLFDWDKNNANKFFRLFGEGFLGYMKDEVNQNDNLDNAIKSFLEIGRERNRLVHSNFGSFNLEKTPNEIYELYKNGISFLNDIPLHLRCIKGFQ